MLKLLFIAFVLGFVVQEFWFLNNLNKEYKLSSSEVKIETLSISKENNSSENKFFNTQLWKPTLADQVAEDEEIEEIDTNSTVSIISTKNSKQLCRGKRCMTIKGFLTDTLLLEDDGKIISLNLSEMIFDEIKFIGISETKLFFENNHSKERYELEFFSYTKIKDKNETKTEKKKDL